MFLYEVLYTIHPQKQTIMILQGVVLMKSSKHCCALLVLIQINDKLMAKCRIPTQGYRCQTAMRQDGKLDALNVAT